MRKFNFSLLLKITGIVFLAFAIVLGNEIRLGIDRYVKNTLETDGESTARTLDRFSKSFTEAYISQNVDIHSEKFETMYRHLLVGDSSLIKCLTDANGKILDISRENSKVPVLEIISNQSSVEDSTVTTFRLTTLEKEDLSTIEDYLLSHQNQMNLVELEYTVLSKTRNGDYDIRVASLSINEDELIKKETSKKTVKASGNITFYSNYNLDIYFPRNETTSISSKYGQPALALVLDYRDALNGLNYHIQKEFSRFVHTASPLISTNYMDYYLTKPYNYNGKQYSTVMLKLYDWNLLSNEEDLESLSNEELEKQTVVGYIFVTQEYQNLIPHTFKQFMLDNSSTYFLALILIACICLAIGYMIIKPIRRIETTAKHIARKEFDYPLETIRHDEIGDLARSIDRMSKELEKTINSLHQEIERVQQLEGIRKDFVSNFTHEIKTPLGIINGFSELVELEKDDKKRNEYIQIIQSETKRINELVLAMLDLSKLESQNITLNLQELDLLDIVDECLDSMMYLFEKKNIQLETSLDSAFIEGDQFKMEMVVTNFISNALRYTKPGHKVYVKVEEHCLSVENEGACIPQEDLQKVWLTFHKVDKSRNDEGTGLGLAICKAILELHHFEYGVQNTSRGVLFYFKY